LYWSCTSNCDDDIRFTSLTLKIPEAIRQDKANDHNNLNHFISPHKQFNTGQQKEEIKKKKYRKGIATVGTVVMYQINQMKKNQQNNNTGGLFSFKASNV